MASRNCIACGEPVDSAFCPNCGLRQPDATPDATETLPMGAQVPPAQTSAAQERAPATASTPPAGQASPVEQEPLQEQASPAPPPASWFAPPTAPKVEDATQRLSNDGPIPLPPMLPLSEQPTAIQPRLPPGSAPRPPVADPPWHPFERPAWEDPARPPPDQPPEFVEWQTEPPPPATTRRRTALLGGLAAAAVVALLVVVGILIVRSNRSATPDDANSGPPTTTGTVSAQTTPASASKAPPVTVTVTSETTPSTVSSTASSEVATSAGTDPLGGPVQDIACAPGYIVQIASGLDQDSFVNRIAALRAAGQVPENVFVANTSSSCPIFTAQTNTIVLYAGPFNGPYDGCDARLKAAPDSFIKGTTPETAKEFVSCLCPTGAATLPTFTAINQSGVWVGELQRVLGNKLNLDIPDLTGDTWGIYTPGTSGAVGQFQTQNGLPVTGAVDTATWQAIQAKTCS